MDNLMSEGPENQTYPPAKPGGSCLQRTLYIFLIIFAISATIVLIIFIIGAFRVNQGVQRLSEATNPIGEFVGDLLVPVTPEIIASPVTVLQNVQDEARLLTVTADYQKNLVAEQRSDLFWGLLGEQLIFEAHGTVAAGIDLSQLTEADIVVVGPDTVWIRLPKAAIFDDLPVLDTQKSKILDRDTGLLTRADPDLETAVRQQAEYEILLVAQEDTSLLERANTNAQEEISKIIKSIGFTEVVFYEDEFPPVTPYAQQAPKGYTSSTPEPASP